MINHVRTHLLNMPPADATAIGEEYIDPGYRPKQLTGAAARVHRLLFGVSPDRYMLNYRARQLLPLVHVPELHQLALQSDSRVTYLPFDQQFADPQLYQPIVKSMSGSGTAEVGGHPQPPDVNGVAYRMWRVSVSGDNALVDYRGVTSRQYPLLPVDGLSASIPLDGDGWIRLRSAVNGNSWLVHWLVRPDWSTATLMRYLKQLDVIAVEQILSALKATDFYVLRDIWYQHPEPDVACGAILLAAAEAIARS